MDLSPTASLFGTPAQLEARDKRMALDTAEARRDRQDLTALGKPQGGVDAMTFPAAKAAIPGVSDNGDTSTRAIPTIAMKQP